MILRTAKYLKKIPSLKGKTYIITGANSGLGYALTEILLEKEAHIITANRNPKRSANAKAKLLEKFPHAKISEYFFDQSDEESIINFVSELAKDKIVFDGFVFNAGIYLPARGLKTSNNMGRTFGINYYGNYLLLKALLAANLIQSDTRLIFTTSAAAYKKLNETQLKRIISGTKVSRHRQYKGSKAALNILIYGLMTQSVDSPLKADAKLALYHPGVSNTNITRFKFKPFNFIVHLFMRIVFHTPRKAVLGAVYALTSDEDFNGLAIVPSGPLETSGVPKTKKIDAKLSKHLPLLINSVNDFLQD